MEEAVERGFITRFEKYDLLFELQGKILTLDHDREISREEQREEDLLGNAVAMIFAEYQEQPFLLDPFLEGLVTPVLENLKERASLWVQARPKTIPSTNSLSRISQLLYQYIKFRGQKTIVRFFPHEVADLDRVLDFMRLIDGLEGDWLWSLQYVALLWMSLICMLPFDFSQFDDPAHYGKTASEVEFFGKKNLGRSGLERNGAALLLSRLYARKDSQDRLPEFINWTQTLLSTDSDLLQSIGALQTLCEIFKNAPAVIVAPHISTALSIGKHVESDGGLMNNSIVRKLRLKLISRAGLRLLPASPIHTRQRGRTLRAVQRDTPQSTAAEESDFDVPEEIEGVLEEIFPGVHDRDTIVRWSAAKSIARICERLPREFNSQVTGTVLGLFSIHSVGVASLYDMPAIAESTWQGACLTCAELARRSLFSESDLPVLVDWMIQAFAFDIRKGAHSVGSSVRDAAAYVLWSLPRAYDVTTLHPFANKLCQKLVTTAVYDREVHIRRAASATFQEYVGRTGLFPDGIDILRKTDFFVVGIRRNAFLISAPQVAEHVAYRNSLIDHALSVTIRHWDQSVRELAAQSLKHICKLDLRNLGPECVTRARKLLAMTDTSDVHGALLTLTELASAFRDAPRDLEMEGWRSKVFSCLADVPVKTIESPRNELVTSAACLLIANSITLHEIQLDTKSSVPHWRKIIDVGLKHRAPAVQEAAATAMAEGGSPIQQQSLARLLGVLDYAAYPNALPEAIECLLECVSKTSRSRMASIEARRNCYVSISQIVERVVSSVQVSLPATKLVAMLDSLLGGLEDYTVDDRGDVGSWARIASLQGLTAVTVAMFTHAPTIVDFAARFPPDRFHAAVAGVLKQGVERLDNVRQKAGESIATLLRTPLPDVPNAAQWHIHGSELLLELFTGDQDASGWQDASWLFPRAVRLLEIAEYRDAVISGLLLSVNSRTDSTKRPASAGLIEYVRKLPVTATKAGILDLHALTEQLLARATANVTANSAVIPVLQLFNVLLEADALTQLAEDAAALESLKSLLRLATLGVGKFKNVQRIQAGMRTCVNLLAVPELYAACVPRLANFLAHDYPRVRADAAEYLYQVLQSRDLGRDTEEAEDLLLETEWLSDAAHAATARLVELLRA